MGAEFLWQKAKDPVAGLESYHAVAQPIDDPGKVHAERLHLRTQKPCHIARAKNGCARSVAVSVRLTVVARTRTRISPGAGRGTGTLRSESLCGEPYWWKTAAFIIAASVIKPVYRIHFVLSEF